MFLSTDDAQYAADKHSQEAHPKVVADLKTAFQHARDQIIPLMDAAERGDPFEQAAIIAGQDALSGLDARL
ncbi:hypothetical protein [Gluconacetobacter tumulicola]|uniref:Uncharacterized protein n=1 Tax=Gluconacetobacter tumulicola TaxID=1017177 RepID=A0A7W4JGH3_9PROT|nr:hypothetical protein [Gluconacetobacter tumulicola]MBB2180617.1 hypothetical protein [Gluconacetobacter tumulicola]